MRDVSINEYAWYYCRRCPQPARMWRMGGQARLDQHSFLFHPGADPDGEVATTNSGLRPPGGAA